MKVGAWLRKKWALPLLWILAAWETEALTRSRYPSISRTANKHPVLTCIALVALARHFVRYQQPTEREVEHG